MPVQVKTGGDSDEDSLFDEDDDSEDEESDEGKLSFRVTSYSSWPWCDVATAATWSLTSTNSALLKLSHALIHCHINVLSDADGRPELKGRAKWLKKAVTAKDPLEDAAKKEEKKRRTDKSDKKR